ncbi:MAG: hypothetical protein M5R38_15020 [Candidatus Methylomirabilis sp.]|nr:hypothetical protein [Candidatus Methylomirabilis sp.]
MVSHEVGSRGRFCPAKIVVEMGDMEYDGISLSKAHQKMEHDHRINAAGDRNDDPLPDRHHPMPVDRLLHLMQQPVLHHVSP